MSRRTRFERVIAFMLVLTLAFCFLVSPVGTQQAKAIAGVDDMTAIMIVLSMLASCGIAMTANPADMQQIGQKIVDGLSDGASAVVSSLSELWQAGYDKTIFAQLSKNDWDILSLDIFQGYQGLLDDKGMLTTTSETIITYNFPGAVPWKIEGVLNENRYNFENCVATWSVSDIPISFPVYHYDEYHSLYGYFSCILFFSDSGGFYIVRLFDGKFQTLDAARRSFSQELAKYPSGSVSSPSNLDFPTATHFGVSFYSLPFDSKFGNQVSMTFNAYQEISSGVYKFLGELDPFRLLAMSGEVGPYVGTRYSVLDHPISVTWPQDKALTHDVVLDRWEALVAEDSLKNDLTFRLPVGLDSLPVAEDGTVTLAPSDVLPNELVKPGEGTIPDTGDKDDAQDVPIEDVELPAADDLMLPAEITTKFPFSIPFDLYRAMSLLAAEPAEPVFHIPIQYGGLIDEEITIDFSQFDEVVATIRWFELIIFCVGLAYATRNLIKW